MERPPPSPAAPPLCSLHRDQFNKARAFELLEITAGQCQASTSPWRLWSFHHRVFALQNKSLVTLLQSVVAQRLFVLLLGYALPRRRSPPHAAAAPLCGCGGG